MKKITIIGMLIAGVILLAVEIPALINEETNDTISEIIWNTGRDYPISVLVVGILLGHFYWPLRKGDRDKTN